MNVKEQEKRLENIFRKNNNKGFAVAITGCWGVGKTFFWNNFFKEKTQEEKQIKDDFYYEASRVDFASAFENKKYAYVSLFGIESMQDLKNAICTKLSTNPHVVESVKRLEFSSLLKKSLEQFKDIKVSQYGVSASAKLLENLLYAQVKDAIICFDDFERMSKKLDIKDVMGLANQLKLERKCQVILILDESKNNEDNEKKYAEYKEKLIDETIKITSVEPLIREKAKDIDEPLVDLMVKFAEKLEIHNFRFFQKVIKLYKQFREQLPQEVAYSTKEIILVRILQGYLIEDFGESLKVQWNDFPLKRPISVTLNKKYKADEEQIKEPELFNKIRSFSNILAYRTDEWLIEFKKWFEQRENMNLDIVYNLLNSEIISEQSNLKKVFFDNCFEEFWGLQANEDFPNQLYIATEQVIGLENLSNLSVALELLETLGKDIQDLESEIIQWIKEQIDQQVDDFILSERFGKIRPTFIKFKNEYLPDKKYSPKLLEAVFNRYVKREWNNRDIVSINNASKEEWAQLLFVDVPNDPRFNTFISSYLVNEILTKTTEGENHRIRSIITEIYEEKGQESDFYNKYMNYLISRLDN